MPHHVVGQHRVVLGREERSDVLLDLVRIHLGRPPESTREAPEVRIDGDPGNVECVAEDNVGGFAAYARK